ncbi:MAG: FtsX-like permease family protein [Gammaproteobacteria bacterium]|nr:FtsX-like permease family protein [Gammaproteobacteria bacterium]MDH5592426.1 FtsX-like permease family protein [Gammaproteobacteria bacterium]
MNIITLAARNVYRNGHRSVVTAAAMAFACAMMIVFASLIEGFVKGSEQNIVAMNSGDIQIHRPGYRDDPDIYSLMIDSADLCNRIRQAGFATSERIFAFGLLASGQSSSGVQLRGLDLDFEPTVTLLNRQVMLGDWLDKTDHHGVVIGKKLARLLDVSLGDELVFVGQTADGYMANDTFYVRGIMRTVSSAIDNAGVLMSKSMLRELIALPEGAHELVVMRTDSMMNLELASQKIKALIRSDLEILNWRQLMPIISRFIETAHVQTLIMMLFTYIAVASVVLNAMLMSVFERIHEFGIMKAIGVRPWQIVRLVYAETFIMTIVASVIGALLGSGITWYLQNHGIDMSSLAEGISFSGIALDPVWYASLSSESVLTPVIFLFVIAAIAVIYPAIKVAVIHPVDAVHHH